MKSLCGFRNETCFCVVSSLRIRTSYYMVHPKQDWGKFQRSARQPDHRNTNLAGDHSLPHNIPQPCVKAYTTLGNGPPKRPLGPFLPSRDVAVELETVRRKRGSAFPLPGAKKKLGGVAVFPRQTSAKPISGVKKELILFSNSPPHFGSLCLGVTRAVGNSLQTQLKNYGGSEAVLAFSPISFNFVQA